MTAPGCAVVVDDDTLCGEGCGCEWSEAHRCVGCECGARVEKSTATPHDGWPEDWYLCADCEGNHLSRDERHPAGAL